jgi:hypothetical protein
MHVKRTNALHVTILLHAYIYFLDFTRYIGVGFKSLSMLKVVKLISKAYVKIMGN